VKRTLLDTSAVRWVDVVAPTPEELDELAKEFSLHPLIVQDCLEPEHLPKVEEIDGSLFIIVRTWDPSATPRASSVQQLTRKIAVFIREQLLLTIHRSELEILDKLSSDQKKSPPRASLNSFTLLIELWKRVILSYDAPLEKIEDELEALEAQVASARSAGRIDRTLHFQRRRLSTLRRLFWHTRNVVQHLPRDRKDHTVLLHDLADEVEHTMFYFDELVDDVTGLMTLEVSRASQRTNEVIRVLTIFSVFFMPLTFIVGVYGMNFTYMPELNWMLGYPFALGIMAGVTLTIWVWFRRKGWM